jgi:hypothetical protein
MRRAAIHYVRLEHLELFSVHFDHQEAIILAPPDYIHHLAHRNCYGDLMIVLVRKCYGWALDAVEHNELP